MKTFTRGETLKQLTDEFIQEHNKIFPEPMRSEFDKLIEDFVTQAIPGEGEVFKLRAAFLIIQKVLK